MKRLAGEIDTIGFVVGFLLIVRGVAMVSVPAAWILGGILICAGAAALSLGRLQGPKQRDAS